MWSTEKNRPTPNEPWNPLTGKPVAPDETAKPRTAPLSNEKPDSAFPAHARKKAICVLCSEPSAERSVVPARTKLGRQPWNTRDGRKRVGAEPLEGTNRPQDCPRWAVGRVRKPLIGNSPGLRNGGDGAGFVN